MSQRVFPRINKPVTSEYVPCGLPTGDVEGPPRPRPPVLPNPSGQLQTGRTIVDVLNPECWRLILEHLNLKDVVRSERVSRGWREVVHCYLQGIKKYNIKVHELGHSIRTNTNYGHIELRKTYDKYCKLQLKGMKKYDMKLNAVLRKVGPWATHLAVDCVHEGDFERVVLNCPRLEHLEIYTQKILPLELAANCKALRSVTFRMGCQESVGKLDDNYLSRLVANESIEELVLEHVNRVTGRFLRNLRSPHLKTLEISQCNGLTLREIYLAVEYLKDLTRLELNLMSDYSEAYLFLEKMPNLEYLSLSARHCGDRRSVVDKRLVDAISRLGRLQYLNLHSNRRASDALLAALARGCKDLRALDVGNCPGVSGRAVAELCTARAPTLCKVYLHNNHNVSRADMWAIIRCYHDIRDQWIAEEIPQQVKTDLLDVIWSGSDLYSIWH